MGEVIVITSGKGGVGKTTTSANIGAGLVALNKKVILIDTDIGLRNLDLVLGLENRVIYNLIDVVEEKCELKDAIMEDFRHPGLFLLPAAQNRDKTALTPGQMRKITEQLKEDYDYVILDCPAGIELGFQNAIAGADRPIIVTNPENAAVRDADRIVGLLSSHGLMRAELIVNRVRPALVKSKDMISPEEIAEMMPVTLLGVIPDDDQVIIGSNKGEPVVGTDCPSGIAYSNICRRIVGEEVALPVFDEQMVSPVKPQVPEQKSEEPAKEPEKKRGFFRRRRRS